MPDGKRIKAVSYDKLMDKLYNYYDDGLLDFSVEFALNAALEEKAVTETHPKKKTFLSFKGILDLIFEYAYMHKIIVENPVSYVKTDLI